MKLTFLGAAHEVTGSCTLLEACGQRILIDCGMEQGSDIYENCELPLAPVEIDFVLLTHAHIDHSGKLPLLTAGGFRSPIYATEATRQLCSIMLRDSAHIQEFEAEWKNRKAKRAGDAVYQPMYTLQDAEHTMQLFHGCTYGERIEPAPGISVRFLDAGHLLGSASIEVTVHENGVAKTVLFSGDLGNRNRPLIRDPQNPECADIVVVESTYGDRLHGARKDYKTQLASMIQETLDRGGNMVIPAFAIGRTQELLYLIREIWEEGLIQGHDDFPIWVDSPLAIEATRIYNGDMMDYYDADTLALIRSGVDVLGVKQLHFAVSSEESKQINFDSTPKIILSASGMCEAGRIRHHLKHNLWRPECTILFVGYQAAGTLGRIILDGAKTVKLFGEEIQVNAQIKTMDGISGHADQQILLDWLGAIPGMPQVYVNHGEDQTCDLFAAEITQKLGFPAVAPYNGASYDLVSGVCYAAGNALRIEKPHGGHNKRTSPAFEKLLLAGKRLMSVIEHNRGGANKDLAKFTSQITELCRKWDR